MSNEHVEALHAARKKLVEERRACIQTLVKVRERGSTAEIREKFLEVQRAIGAIDDAIEDEKRLNPGETMVAASGDIAG
jgi:hypothetical protein